MNLSEWRGKWEVDKVPEETAEKGLKRKAWINHQSTARKVSLKQKR